MTTPIRLLNRLLSRAAARFRDARPGSVLILVVALLVLMALIGTAFISTARIDRYSATQNTYNTEVDLLIQGILGLSNGSLVQKVDGSSGNYRGAISATQYPTTASPTTGLYYPWEFPLNDTYLSSRIPTTVTGGNGWAYITAPINVSSTGTPVFEDPSTGTTYTQRTNLIPTSKPVAQADGSQRIYPAFLLSNGTTVVAADTDGDGIADAGFVRLPVGQLEGTVYYVAVRIIDNSGCINASVANQPFNTGAGWPQNTAPGDISTGNVDLQDMVGANGDTATGLNTYRNTAATPAPPFGRTDFQFNTPYEAAWALLGSCVNNPVTTQYQAVPISEGIGLARHGGLVDITAPGPSPVLETLLPTSLYNNPAKCAPFAPSDTVDWWNLYNYSGTYPNPSPVSLRPFVVVRNPLSSFVPSYFPDQGFWSAGQTYTFGMRVQYTDPNTASTSAPSGNLRGFVCVQPNVGVAPVTGGTYSNAYWAAMPWASAPTKINANTATFGQLWTAYWSVMQDSPDVNGAYNTGNGQTDAPAPNNQFRSPIRNTSVPLTRSQVIQLRAALAAVNTIDMRDGDEDCTSRTVALTAANGATVYANVYGAEKQPYITEVLIDYDPNSPTPAVPNVVIELYNPHPTPIPLAYWKLAYITPGAAGLTLTEVGDMNKTLGSTTHPGGLQGPIIAPGERIVLENQIPVHTALAASWSARNPPFVPITNQSTTGADLDAAVGFELVLLRPRSAGGVLTSSNAADNYFNENGSLYDLIPLDNVDMTGIAVSKASSPPPPQRYRYARANLITNTTASAAWHCVFPGPYTFSNTGGQNSVGPFRQGGMLAVNPLTDAGNFGLPKGKWTGTNGANDIPTNATYETRPLQINNRDSAGPNRPYTDNLTNGNPAVPNGSVSPMTATKSLPLGGFARSGDLLTVPLIGSYRITASNPALVPPSQDTLEMNSVTMDSVYAQFQSPTYNVPLPSSWDSDSTIVSVVHSAAVVLPAFHNEQIGHFCPMTVGGTDFSNEDPPTGAGWTYHWAKRLFDYLDVHTPQENFLPNVDPAGGDPSVAGSLTKYPGPTPVPISGILSVTTGSNTNPYALEGQLDTASTEGKININTAHWMVLATVPWYTPGEDANYISDNINLAKYITNFRDSSGANFGPFRSIFDLIKVQQFATTKKTILAANENYNAFWVTASGATTPDEVTNQYGDLSPFYPTWAAANVSGNPPAYTPSETDSTDHVYGDVKTRFLGLMRVSNLLTTRSDSFTVYAQVQGWQNVGVSGTAPTLVATRRVAAFLDRSQVIPQRLTSTPNTVSPTPMGIINVPND